MQSEAGRIREEEAELARKSVKTEFSERLQNPTAGSRNLLRCMELKAQKSSPQAASPTLLAPKPIKSITAKELLQQHKQQMQILKASQSAQSPQLGRGLQELQDEIDLSEEIVAASPSSRSHPKMESAKLKALRLIRQKGPLQKADPNSPSQKPKTPELQAKMRKRVRKEDEALRGESGDEEERPKPSKRSKAELDSLMEAKSSHSHLVDQHDAQQSEQYFSKLEHKEQMENKMLDTFEIKTTAVTCSKVRLRFLFLKCIYFILLFLFCSASTLPCRLLSSAGVRGTQFGASRPSSVSSSARAASRGPSAWIGYRNGPAPIAATRTGKRSPWQRYRKGFQRTTLKTAINDANFYFCRSARDLCCRTKSFFSVAKR